jgi:hypothetical protein
VLLEEVGGVLKKYVFILLVSLFTLVGCQQENENVESPTNTKEEETAKEAKGITDIPDYDNVFIYEIKETSILIAPPATDPTASYPVYEIFIEDDTVIESKKEDFEGLEKGSYVQVWVKDQGTDKKIAKKIIAEDRSYNSTF